MGLRRSFKPTNIIQNGDFSKGTTGWINNGSIGFGVSENILSFTPKARHNGTYQSVNVIANHKYYYSVQVKREALPAASYAIFISGSVVAAETTNWQTLSKIDTAPTNAGALFRVQENRAENYSVDAIKIKNPILIDLTALFGAGNEPSKAWCDLNIPNWFDGTLGSGVINGTGGLK